MSTTVNAPASTTQNEIQLAVGNLANEYILQITPGLTTSIVANTTTTVNFTIPGLQLFDFIEVNRLNDITGLSIGNTRCSALNTLSVQFVNSTASPISLQVGDIYLVSVERPMAQYIINGLPSGIPT